MPLLIDTNNQFRCVRRAFKNERARIDYQKLMEAVESEFGTQEHKVAYIAKYFKDSAIRFSDKMRSIGFKTKLKETREQVLGDRKIQVADCGIDLVVDCFRLHNANEPLVIGSSDYRLEPLLRHFKGEVLVWSCGVPSVFGKYAEVREMTEEFLQED